MLNRLVRDGKLGQVVTNHLGLFTKVENGKGQQNNAITLECTIRDRAPNKMQMLPEITNQDNK